MRKETNISMKISKHYGEGGRLNKAAAEVLINSAYDHDCEDADIVFPYLVYANLAYAIMLMETKIVPQEPAKRIINALIDIHENVDLEKIKIDPKNGDIYNNFDVLLRDRIGNDAGWLHTGRPRREAVNIAFVLITRKYWLDLMNTFFSLIETVIKVVEENREVIMPDFTYLHHAQPTSLSHYLLTFVSASMRDLQRLEASYQRLDLSTGGSGSVNGSSLPLSKEKIRKLLSFDAVAAHSRDAMWMPDIPFELMQVIGSLMMNWSRLAEEIQIWSTKEFDFIELPDSLCRASVIMPHKKNPYPVTYFRGLTSNIISKISNYGMYGKIFSGNPDSRIFIYGDLPKTIEKADKALKLLDAVIRDSTFKKEVMENSLKNDFSAATDIADYLIFKEKIDYRSAHQIVGKMVKKLNDQNKGFEDFKSEDLASISTEVVGYPIKIEQKEIAEIIDPKNIIASRKTTGGAAPEQISMMLENYRQSLEKSKSWLKNKSIIIQQFKSNLIDEAKKYE